MKKEDILMFSLPFRIITKDKTFYTVKKIRELTDLSLAFYDKFGGLNVVDLVDISQVKEINNKKEEDDKNVRRV